jgi:phage FluMu protein Com
LRACEHRGALLSDAEVKFMTQLVQSKCPGCKHVLHIPADWVSQAIRCKHCGLVLQARQSASPTRTASPPPLSRTPPPATRTTNPLAHAVSSDPVPRAVPVAAPVGDSGSPFSSFSPDEEESRPSRRRRRKASGGWWKGPVVALAFLLVAGIGAFFAWPYLSPVLFPPEDKDLVAQSDSSSSQSRDTGSSTKTPSKKDGLKKSGPGRPGNDTGRKTRPDTTPSTPPRPQGNSPFPRRALVISVHDYLYANPVHDGVPDRLGRTNTIKKFSEELIYRLRVPPAQVAHLSDLAAGKEARAPLKPVIEKTLTNFLDGSRAQDRILVVFIGHAVEIGDDVFLVPIEGELDEAATLIPLKWVYEQLGKCKARQKVLVLDVNRFNPTTGQERPDGGPMGPKLDAACQKPPAGVQVWSSCSAKQRSYETADSPVGVFIDELTEAMRKDLGNGKIQKPEEPFPLDRLVAAVNERMKNELGKRKLEQVSRLSGTEADSGVTFDKSEPPAPEARLALAPAPAQNRESLAVIESVLAQIGTPSIKPSLNEVALRTDVLPPFPADALAKYEQDKPKPDSKLRPAVTQARAVLWAISTEKEPAELSAEVAKARQEIKVKLDVLKEGYRAPAGAGNAEKAFKDNVERDERAVARMMRALTDALEMMQSEPVKEERGEETKRWQANYDFVLARLQAQIAFLYEYQSMLGQIRKEFPPRDPNLHSGWRLASQMTLSGDSTGKRLASTSRKSLEKLAKEHKNTPWAVLAKREKLTALGLEWQPSSR